MLLRQLLIHLGIEIFRLVPQLQHDLILKLLVKLQVADLMTLKVTHVRVDSRKTASLKLPLVVYINRCDRWHLLNLISLVFCLIAL